MVRRKKMNPPPSSTRDRMSPWIREAFLKRRESWTWRMVPFIKEMIADKCATCQKQNKCHRIPCDQKAIAEALKDKNCSEYKSVWKPILDEEKHDWGF